MDLQTVGASLVMELTQKPLSVVVLLVLAVTLVQVLLLSRRVARLTRGASGASLESTISALGTATTLLESHAKTTESALNNLDTRLQSALRSVSVRRFDPFQNAGGQQSFATALLNERGDGVVLSGIHARDSVRVYAKNVTRFASERELSDEEARAIDDAKKQLL